MKKLFNNALIYHYYMLGRGPAIVGSFIFAFISYFSMQSDLSDVRYAISGFHWNMISSVNFIVLLLSWFILAGVYFFITGINKKSSMAFLQSGPFTKEQIKFNQVIILFISLILMILAYIYVFCCITYTKQELISLIPNYYTAFLKDIIRIFLCGAAFISYLVFMDMIFSNIILEIVAIFVLPFILLFLVFEFTSLYFSIIGESIYKISFIEKIGDTLDSVLNYVIYNNRMMMVNIESTSSSVAMVVILIGTLMLLIASWFLNKNYKMNNVNKFFNFRFARISFEYTISLSVVFMFQQMFIQGYKYKYFINKSNEVLIMYLLIIIIISIIVSWFLCKTLDKCIKKYL